MLPLPMHADRTVTVTPTISQPSTMFLSSAALQGDSSSKVVINHDLGSCSYSGSISGGATEGELPLIEAQIVDQREISQVIDEREGLAIVHDARNEKGNTRITSERVNEVHEINTTINDA
jgi:hypothetical protein